MIDIIFTDEVLKTVEFIYNKDEYANNKIDIIWCRFQIDRYEDTDLFLYPETDRFNDIGFWEKHSIRHGNELIRFLKNHTNFNIYLSMDMYCDVFRKLKMTLN